MAKRKTLDELIDDFATTSLQAGMARAALTRARRYARDMGVAGTTAREVAAKQKFQALERKLWALADQAKKAKPAPAETPAARFYRLMNEAQSVEELDRVLTDAQATLKGADLNSAENYAKDRWAALAGRSE